MLGKLFSKADGWKTYLVAGACAVAGALLLAFGGEQWHAAGANLIGLSGLGAAMRQTLSKILDGLPVFDDMEIVPEPKTDPKA